MLMFSKEIPSQLLDTISKQELTPHLCKTLQKRQSFTMTHIKHLKKEKKNTDQSCSEGTFSAE